MDKKSKLFELESKLILDENSKPYYHNFDANKFGDSLEPGSMPAPYFYDWVADETNKRLGTEPVLGIEVGSYLGYSSIGFAKKLKEHNPNSKLICIDTWLGSSEHFFHIDQKPDYRYGWVNGYPTMYHKFISNVILHGVQDIIIPLPFPSITAFRILFKLLNELKLQADFAYIDGSHEKDEVYMDLFYYYQLLDNKSYLCGDDWAWEAVKGDVIKFAESHGFNYKVLQNEVHWIIEK